jgi:hypothetical protein
LKQNIPLTASMANKFAELRSRMSPESQARAELKLKAILAEMPQVVDGGDNGFLCQVGSAPDLAEKMGRMLTLSDAQRTEMGLRGRVHNIERPHKH